MKDKDKICKNEMQRAWENRKKELVDKYREVIEKEFTKLNTEMHRTGKTYEKTEFRKRFEDEWA